MSIVSSSGMLVKEATIKNLESCSTISSAKANESFTVHLLLVKVFKIGTRNFANIKADILLDVTSFFQILSLNVFLAPQQKS